MLLSQNKKAPEVVRQLEISEQTYHHWNKGFGRQVTVLCLADILLMFVEDYPKDLITEATYLDFQEALWDIGDHMNHLRNNEKHP